MTTTTAFPVLLTLQVTPQTLYDLLQQGIECERIKMQAMQATQNDAQYFKSTAKILQGERVLTFMRDIASPGEINNRLH